MSGPQRIQRRRTCGWRMPKRAVYVGRPTRWGNPYTLHPHDPRMVMRDGRLWVAGPIASDARSFTVAQFRLDLLDGLLPSTVEDVRRELAGQDLVCWCRLDQACHADVLLELANERVGGDEGASGVGEVAFVPPVVGRLHVRTVP